MNHPLTLLFGLPRSGTTWIAKIFDSHPDSLYFHEPDSLNKLVLFPHDSNSWDGAPRQQSMEKYVEDFIKLKSPHVNGKLPLFEKHYRSTLAQKLHHFNIITSKGSQSLFDIALPSNYWISHKNSQKAHWVWKSIESTKHLGLMLEALPTARSILILRHPCGQIASAIRGEKSVPGFSRIDASEDIEAFEKLAASDVGQRHNLSLEKFENMHPIERRAWRWALPYEKTMLQTQENDRCMLVRYEDVATNPLLWAQKMFEFAGLEWSSQTEAFVQQSASLQNDDYYSVYKDSQVTMTRWQKELSMNDASMIMDVVSQTLPGKLFL